MLAFGHRTKDVVVPFNLNPTVAIIAAVIVVFLIVLIYARSIYKNAGPDEAILITGKRAKVKTVDGVATEESGIRIVV